MTNETPNTKPHRRWYQFSLRTLLIVVAVSAIPLSWVGWKLEQARRQRAAIAWVEKVRGSVEFDYATEKSWWKEWTDKWVDESVRWVNLKNTGVSDLSPLAELKNLERLVLDNTQVSDLSPLAELKSLNSLHLENTPLSDISPLAELKSLKWLNLGNTHVSDLSPLAELKNLESLLLHHTQVSAEQVQELRKALPNCDILSPFDLD